MCESVFITISAIEIIAGLITSASILLCRILRAIDPLSFIFNFPSNYIVAFTHILHCRHIFKSFIFCPNYSFSNGFYGKSNIFLHTPHMSMCNQFTTVFTFFINNYPISPIQQYEILLYASELGKYYTWLR